MMRVLTHRGVMISIILLVLGLQGGMPDDARSQDQETETPARGMFLVASRQLKDPLFRESVVLLLNADRNGAMGLIINKSTERSLSSVFPEMRKTDHWKDQLYFGGPVMPAQLLMLIRSKETLKDTVRILSDVIVSTDKTVLTDALKKKWAGDEYRVYAGYAGWTAGQLEWEIRRGDWYLIPADAATIFHDDEQKVWPALLRKSQEIIVRDFPGELREAMVTGRDAPRYAFWRY